MRKRVQARSKRELQNNDTDRINFHNEHFHRCYALWQSSSQALVFWNIYTGASLRITPLPSSLFLLRSLRGDSSFESFSARRIASFRRIFYKLWPFRKAVLLYRLSRSNASNHSFVTNA